MIGTLAMAVGGAAEQPSPLVPLLIMGGIYYVIVLVLMTVNTANVLEKIEEGNYKGNNVTAMMLLELPPWKWLRVVVVVVATVGWPLYFAIAVVVLLAVLIFYIAPTEMWKAVKKIGHQLGS